MASRKIFKKILLVLISINLILPNAAFGDFFIPYVNISGQVKDIDTNQAIQGAKVFFEPDWGLLPSPPFFSNDINTTTNEFGKYFFQFSFPPDKGSLIVRADGYEENRAEGVVLPMYSTVEVNFEMKPKQKLKPVILIPGIMGSYLNKTDSGDEVWPNVGKMFLSWNDDYLNDLILPQTGIPKTESIIPGDIVRKISDNDFFEGLIGELENSGYEKNKNLFVFPYDWRLDIGYLAGVESESGANTLKNKVEEVINKTGSEKIDLIAHSMGGLVAKKYMQEFGIEHIGKFIDLATPHLGAPKAAKILLYGDNMDFRFLGSYILSQERVKIISQNMPAVYELLPSRLYFDENNNDYKAYLADIFDIDNNGITGNLGYGKSMDLLNNTGRNIALTYAAGILHDNIDNYSPEANGVKAYNLVGCGEPTIGKIYMLNKEKSGGNEYGLRYISGDGTVPMKSAEHLETANEFYIKEVSHARIPSNGNAEDLIVSILKNDLDSFNFLNYINLSENSNFCSLNGAQVSYHSPIDLHIYDEYGNHAGPKENDDIEINIPGVSYDVIDNNKFAFLPKGRNYTIKGEATDIGTFNMRVEKIENSEYIETAYFNEIPLSSINTKTQIEIGSKFDNYNSIAIQIDLDGDSFYDKNIKPDSVLIGEDVLDIEKPETKINIIGEKESSDTEYYLDSVLIELTAQDNKNGSGILKTEYSLDNGASWKIYSEPLILDILQLSTTTEVTYGIQYGSTDKAGNRENVKKETVKIKKLITIKSLISDIEELYNKGEIKKKSVKDRLIKDLTWISKYIEKNNKKRIKLNKRMGKICEKIKNKEKCEQIFSSIPDRPELHLDKIRKKIIKIKTENILKRMDFYYNRQWISELGYDIIRMELNYLINNNI